MLNFNVNEELSNYEQIDLESVEKKIGIIPYDMKQAIELYNKALVDLRSRNEDIAIIALKKAISLYPAFYEAMNLMGISYLSLNEEDNARSMFKKVIQMEDSSIRASNYIARLDGKGLSEEQFSSKNSKKFKNKKKKEAANSWLRDNFGQDKGKNLLTKNIVGVLIGILLMGILWIVIPGTPINIDVGSMFKRTENLSPQIVKLENEKTELTNRLTEANEALRTANETENQLRDQIEQYSYWSNVLRNLQQLADNGRYKDVVIQIERDLAGLPKPEDIENEINVLEVECKPKAVSQFYEEGREIYRSNSKTRSLDEYRNAANEYIMAISIIEEIEELPSNINALNVYYYGGKAIALSEYPTKEEAEKEALRCFNTILEIGPNSEMASYARSRIRDIDNGKKISH